MFEANTVVVLALIRFCLDLELPNWFGDYERVLQALAGRSDKVEQSVSWRNVICRDQVVAGRAMIYTERSTGLPSIRTTRLRNFERSCDHVVVVFLYSSERDRRCRDGHSWIREMSTYDFRGWGGGREGHVE